jgi:hypothetical protein
MRTGRYLLTCAVLLCVAIAWNAVFHPVVLQAANASVQHLRRADLVDEAWLSLALTAGIVVMFVGGDGRVARPVVPAGKAGTWRPPVSGGCV